MDINRDYLVVVKEEIKKRKERRKNDELLNSFMDAQRKDHAQRKSVPCIYLVSILHLEWLRTQYVIYGPASMNNEQDISQLIDLVWKILDVKKSTKEVTFSDICNVIENAEKRVIVEVYNKNVNIPAIKWSIGIDKKISHLK